MPLFFIISGFLYKLKSQENNSYKEFIKPKLKNIMYPYVTFSIVILIWYVIFYLVFKFHATDGFKYVLLSSLTTYGYHALWFLPVLFFSSVLYIVFVKKLKKAAIVPILILALSGIILFYFSNRFTYSEIGILYYLIIYFGRIFIAQSFIYIGSVLFKILEKIECMRFSVFIQIAMCIIFFVMSVLLFDKNKLTANMAASNIGNPLLYYINSCTGSFFVFLFCKLFLNKRKALAYLGKNSLIIMAIHMDITIETAYLIIGATHISNIIHSDIIISIIAIILEFIFFIISITVINKYFKFLIILLNLHKIKKEDTQ